MKTDRNGKGLGKRGLFRALSGTLALTLLLGGCGTPSQKPTEGKNAPTEAAAAATVLPDGIPGTVGEKGTYTLPFDGSAQVASVGDAKLTNGMLGIFYRQALLQAAGEEQGPDLSQPLDTQRCLFTDTELSWQQVILGSALDSWHTLQALEQKSRETVVRQELNFEPIPELHQEYMSNVPANDILYDLDATFKPNTMHQAYLDGIPQMLETLAREQGYADLDIMARDQFGAGVTGQDLTDYAALLNWSYMYYTEQGYDIAPTAEEVAVEMTTSGNYLVNLRHILLVPQDAAVDAQGRVTATEEQWAARETDAKNMLQKWKANRPTEVSFSVLAHDNSQDPGSSLNGGLYVDLHQGQLIKPLDDWCFDPAREPGDSEILRSDFGWHILYFCGKQDEAYAQTEAKLRSQQLRKLAEQAKKDYPMTVSYDKITLEPVEKAPTLDLNQAVLYPDVAHERFPEVPVYIQQDYKKAPYGGYNVSSHGCGITSLAMLSTYMTDTRLTPAMLAARYGRYNGLHGTDTMIFINTPPEMGYFLDHRAFTWQDIEDSLNQGKMVINLQSKGYFTKTGHFLVLTHMTENGNVVIRDSNIYNYKRLPEHSVDEFSPKLFPPASRYSWVYDNKVTRIPACHRCGDGEGVPGLFREEYLCHKCIPAVERRESFLQLCQG